MEGHNNPNREATKSEIFMYKWGAPLSYVILWTINLCITLNVNGILFYIDPTGEAHEAIQFSSVFILSFFQVAVSFFFIACDPRIRAVNIKIFKAIALFIVLIVLNFLTIGIYFTAGHYTAIIALIVISATAEGVVRWIQHNLDDYTTELPDGNGNYVQTEITTETITEIRTEIKTETKTETIIKREKTVH